MGSVCLLGRGSQQRHKENKMLFCMVCRGEMPEDRARQKKARVCSEACKTEYRRLMGLERDKRICRLLWQAIPQTSQP